MGRKYIDDLGIKFEDTPQGWCSGDDREAIWELQRETFGFDEREIWSLDYTFQLWLYERLSMFNMINTIDTSYNKFQYKGETLTLQDCIDRMLEGLKISLTINKHEQTEEQQKKSMEVVELFALCLDDLWW